jgi:peptidoglycan/LPS O-acetylase OafA/YrhL
MGLIRLLLALAVVLVHSPFPPWSRSPMIGGNIAVEMFFMISGFYMELVLTTTYRTASGRSAALLFWVSRFLRIYPTYWIVAACMLGFLAATSPSMWHEAMSAFGPGGAAYLVVVNLIIFGQDLVFWIGRSPLGFHLTTNAVVGPGPTLIQFLLDPPSWTLALELTFYLLVPLLTQLSSLWLVLIALASAGMRAVAYLRFGLYNDAFLYQFLPFELMYFVVGMLAFRLYRAGFVCTGVPGIAVYVVFVGYLLGIRFIPRPLLAEKAIFDLLLFAGFLAALPSIFALSKDWTSDRLIGELSYPVYLTHVLVYRIMEWALGREGHDAAKQAFAVILILAASVLLHWAVERPIDAVRHGFTSGRLKLRFKPVMS